MHEFLLKEKTLISETFINEYDFNGVFLLA